MSVKLLYIFFMPFNGLSVVAALFRPRAGVIADVLRARCPQGLPVLPSAICR